MQYGLNMVISQQRRAAEVKINKYWSTVLGVPEGTIPCHVLGIFQSADDDAACPVAVCELSDGRMFDPLVGTIRFTDTIDGEIRC